MKSPHETRSSVDVKWSRLPDRWLKCNVDAGMFQVCGIIGSDVVLCDCHGSFVTARSNTWYSSVLTPSVAEALSFREALSWLKEVGMSLVLLESNALIVINAIKHCKVDDACFGFIIADCISLSKEILNCSISFVRRSVNQVAHVLARTFVSMSSLGV